MASKHLRTYSDLRDAIFEEIFLIAKKDKDVVVLMADQDAFTFGKFRKEIPDQLINVGIAEQNMVSVAAKRYSSTRLLIFSRCARMSRSRWTWAS